MKLGMKTAFAAGLIAGFVSLGATTVSALPLLGSKVVARSEISPQVDKVYYRCGYYGCYHRRYYRVYRPYYGYGYYRPYYYRPHIGIGIGGIGLGFY